MFLNNKLALLRLIHKITCPHTSRQNGAVESRLKRVDENGLALLFQAGIPIKYWVYAIKTTLYVSNTPSKGINFQIPYALLYDRIANYLFLECLSHNVSLPHTFQQTQTPMTFN